MNAYHFELLNSKYEDLEIFIPDGSNKKAAVNKAKRAMEERGISNAYLSVNSMRTNNLLDVIEINL
jgi:hypothetical protein